MIHFFLTFSDDASDSPFAHALRDLGVPHRIFSSAVRLRYRHRIWLVLFGLPKLGLFGLRSVWRSLVKAQPSPDVVVVGSHIEALSFVVGRWLLRKRVRVVLLGFIFTRRSNQLLDALRRRYFGWLFARLDAVLCHSRLEVDRYDELFPRARGKFVFVLYGLHIHGHDIATPFVAPAASAALSAGRSGRDYPLLFRVFAESGYPLRVICDSAAALSGCIAAPNCEVLRDCYEDAYSNELRKAGLVIVPLKVGDISAGQMVLIQAMAYRKPLVVTRTPTIDDYLQHERNALLVPPGDASALRAAVDRLRQDPSLAEALANGAYRSFEDSFCMKAFVGRIVRAVQQAT